MPLKPASVSPVPALHILLKSQRRSENAGLPLHTFCNLTIQIKHSLTAVEAEPLFVILSDVERATRRRVEKEERGRQVIQDYGVDMSFPWTCYSCSIVFCVIRRVQPHLSAPNSPLAPINGAPWTSIDDEIMSSCCLVNAVPPHHHQPSPPPSDSHTLKLPLAHFLMCRALQ